MTYEELNKQISIRQDMKLRLKTKFDLDMASVDKSLNELIKARNLIEDGLNDDAADAGVHIIEVRNSNDYFTKECIDAINEAIKDLRNGAKTLKEEYIGVKSYSGWNSQRVSCGHFMGPKHGSVWFRIELKEKYWKQNLTEDETLACIQYLRFYLNDMQRNKFIRYTTD
jgi:hypothetical protein